MAEAARDHGPGVRIPPPVYFVGVMAAAWLLDRVWTVQIGPPLTELGTMVIFLAIALCGWAVLVLVKAGNDPRPDKPDAAMVEAGPYRFSRNPIYLGFLLAATGLALVWGTLWGWIGVAVLHGLLDRLVIAKEESYLSARFGAPYAAYKARVRRWM
ncbi:isoprenylcysteine carboxylmethyltransferase family protein [Falsiroseomonas bella]|uniref:Isoprenylcysteine carboxylmethyltransferase family protein n=1 Tax=Falsiroseomonas bella TaxID=2184016 RepID=A0A317FFJ1_9PROT|nr:isoprenylcysteine carboxylmethyltransferase family protein [Falsiroseomonas bella]PWS37841.1 isoprenylcysteine carboxylmethyltransferase family protein [Falsiroseomonas bella]